MYMSQLCNPFQDDLEEEIFMHSMSTHLQLLVGLVRSNPTMSWIYKILWRVETVVIMLTLVFIVLSVVRYVHLLNTVRMSP